ncbi:MAG: T9SS type A sorting domain-containing protein [Candidatus Zhuqueibacterota bacterium]
MKTKLSIVVMCLTMVIAVLAHGQALERPNVIWARTTSETITLDGLLTEASWSNAEAVRIQHGQTSTLIPGSGWYNEAGVAPSDPTDATLKFLVSGNNLYVAAQVKDASVGGGLFNKFDGFLMNLRDHSGAGRPAGSFEYFYGWVTETWADTTLDEVGALPGFFGWASGDRLVWDAVTVVDGVSNDDATPDGGYTVELMFNLDPRGYDVTASDGDIVEFNISIYDADWQWPLDMEKFSGNRTWWGGPWGNASAYDVIRIYAKPSVTVASGAVPVVGPEIVVPNGVNHADPVIDGVLDETVWSKIEGLDIRYGDDDLRASYPGIGPWRSGQYQPAINSVTAAVVDPGDATVKWFFKGDMLYLGVDVRDQAVWGLNNFDQWDGIRFIINDRAELSEAEHNLISQQLTVRMDSLGQMIAGDYLAMLIDSLQGGQAALKLKGASTANDFNDIDEGYSIEIAVDLKKLGYPTGRGDGVLFISATLFDGDSFANPADDYGTRTWWMRESTWPAGPALAYMDPAEVIENGHEATELERPNVIWARTTSETITLDGLLTEASWSNAEAVRIQHGQTSTLIPGSGWYNEAGVAPSDPTDATLKFLVSGNNLYVAAQVKDASVGGGLFNKFDGFLMNLRDHSGAGRPAGSFEYFYGWVTETWADTTLDEVGALPGFFGWASGDRLVWDAVTVVDGVSNDDATPDGGYTVELMFNLDPRGYDVTASDGDIVEFNISIYDADWQWPLDMEKFSGNRTWWGGPWGNASAYDVIRIYAKPSVTVASGAVPVVGPEIVVPNGVNHADPVIDGVLDETVWSKIEGLDIRYGDDDLRASYPGIGPWRSGQYQPAINSVTAAVVDPGDATVKWFFKGDMLYLGVDVRDQAVWGLNNFDQWDGIRFIINDRAELSEAEHNLISQQLTVRMDSLGQMIAGDYLAMLIDSLQGGQAALKLKGASTANDFNDIDEGYSIEIAVDLKKLGYPVGRGDGVLLISATLFDGDSFANPADDYGTRTWWMRESTWPAAPAWAFMDPEVIIPGGASQIDKENGQLPTEFEIVSNYPNPFNPSTTIVYSLPAEGSVVLKVYNVLGRAVAVQQLGLQQAGTKSILFDARNLGSGVYFYQLQYQSKARGTMVTSAHKMLILK